MSESNEKINEPKVLVVYNNKGGVGKTNLCVNLGEVLGSIYHKKVLLIDNDAQNSLSFLCNMPINEYGALEHESGHPDLGSLIGNIQWDGLDAVPDFEDLREAIVTPTYTKRVKVPNSMQWKDEVVNFSFDLLPGYNKDLSLVELMYVAPTDEPWILQDDNRRYARYLLKLVVDQIKKYFDYDYIIIDCPPSMAVLSISALVAGGELIIPTSPDMLSVVGINNIIMNLRELNRFVPDFHVLGILFNQYSGTKGDDRMVADVEQYGKESGINVFHTRIPRVNQMKTVSSEEQIGVLMKTKPYRMFRESIIALAKEIMEKEKENDA